jgi:UDP-glucose 4-epimerase
MSTRKYAVVTGAAGFIGSHMVDLLLAEGYEVRGIDNLSTGRLDNLQHLTGTPTFTLHQQDIRKIRPADLVFRGTHYVFHFAGLGDIVPSIDRPYGYMVTNVMGTIRVLEAARHARVRKLIYAASSSCYGLATELPTSELAPINPQYPYALSKHMGEQVVMHWNRVYHLPVNSIRIFNAYGPRSRTTGAYGAVFGVFLAQKLAGKPYTVVGDGTQTRDFIFVTDVAAAFLAAAASDRVGQTYNVGAGRPQAVNRLVELLGGPRVSVPKRPGEPDCTWADTSKIRRELGWKPRVSFEQGVSRMLGVIDYWRSAPVWDPASIEDATKTWFQMLTRS